MMQSGRPEGLHQLSHAQATEVTCASAVFWVGAGIVALEKGDTFRGSQRREPPGKVLSGWCVNTSNIYSTNEMHSPYTDKEGGDILSLRAV